MSKSLTLETFHWIRQSDSWDMKYSGVKWGQKTSRKYWLISLKPRDVCISLEFFQGSRMSTDRANFTSLDKYRRLEFIKFNFKLTVLVKWPNKDRPDISYEKLIVCQLF